MLAEILSQPGRRDPRDLALLVAGLDTETMLYASLLSSYGDPAALPALSAALDRADVVSDSFGLGPIGEIAYAIEALGGELTPDQIVKRALNRHRHRARRAAGRLRSAPGSGPSSRDDSGDLAKTGFVFCTNPVPTAVGTTPY